MQSILLTNNWHDSNKGDGGIAVGQLTILRRLFPGSQLGVVSRFEEQDRRFQDAARHLQREFPDIRVLGSPLPTRPEWSRYGWTGRQIERLRWVLRLVGTLRFLVGFGSHPTIRAVRDADLTVDQGGHYFLAADAGPSSVVSLCARSFYMLLRHRFGRPHVVYGASIGPTVGTISQRLMRFAFSRTTLVSVREQLSRDELVRIGIVKPAQLVPDGAFFITPLFSERVRRTVATLGPHLLIVTPRDPTIGRRTLATDAIYEQYLSRLADGIRDFLASEDSDVRVCVVAQCSGPTEREDDRVAAARLAALLPREHSIVLLQDFSPRELVALYSHGRVLVGTRFHSVIFALATGTPCVAISYFGPKAVGIMRLLGYEAYTLDAHCLDKDRLTSAIRELWASSDKLRPNILAAVRGLQELNRPFEDELLRQFDLHTPSSSVTPGTRRVD
jgi:colanic acid/amylovoran biosynthesis protein